MTDPSPQPVINYASPGAMRPPRRFTKGVFGWVLFIGLAVMIFIVLQGNRQPSFEIPLSELTTELSNGNVREVVIDGDTLRGHFVKPPASRPSASAAMAFRVELPPTTGQSWSFLQWLLDHRMDAEVRVENNPNLLVNLLLPLVPWILVFGFIWFFVFRQLRKASTQPKPMPVYIIDPEKK
jgi:cell division protease FtsH